MLPRCDISRRLRMARKVLSTGALEEQRKAIRTLVKNNPKTTPNQPLICLKTTPNQPLKIEIEKKTEIENNIKNNTKNNIESYSKKEVESKTKAESESTSTIISNKVNNSYLDNTIDYSNNTITKAQSEPPVHSNIDDDRDFLSSIMLDDDDEDMTSNCVGGSMGMDEYWEMRLRMGLGV
jgi:hypothetical protein